MTATTKTYLQRLPVAFGVLVIAYVLRYIFLHSFEVEPSAIYWPQFPAFFVTGAGILLALGILLDAIPTAGIAIMVHGGVTVFHFLLGGATGQSPLPPPAEVAVSLYHNIELLPFIFFVSRHTQHWKQQRIWLIVAVFVLYSGLIVSGIGHAFDGFSPIDYTSWYRELIHACLKIASWSSFVLLLAELISHAEKKEKPVFNKFNIITDANHSANTIIFFSYKSLLLFNPWLLTNLLSQPPSAQMENEHDWALFLLRLNWLLSIICCLIVLGISMFYLRTYILTFMLQFGISFRAVFWLLTIPLIGLIAWLLIGATGKRQSDKKQQLITVGKFRKDSLVPPVIGVILFYILAGAWLNQVIVVWDITYVLISSAVFFIISLINMQAYRVQLGILVAIVIYFMVSRMLDGEDVYSTYFETDGMGKAFGYLKFIFTVQLALLGAACSILLLPALHPDYFKTDDEKITTEDHLFAEHELQ